MSIVAFDGPPSCSLNASETGESTKFTWVGVVEGAAGKKAQSDHKRYRKSSDCGNFEAEHSKW